MRLTSNFLLLYPEEDDFCEPGCESPSMDCIDDVNIGDDGKDSTNEEDEEETSNCGGEPCTDTEKEDSTLDDEQGLSGDEESASDEAPTQVSVTP